MSFELACGDVMPGCAATFSADTKDDLMKDVAAHAKADHDITEITPEVAAAVGAQVKQT